MSCLSVCRSCRALGVLLRCNVLLKDGGWKDLCVPPAPQSPAVVLLRQGPPHPCGYLGT